VAIDEREETRFRAVAEIPSMTCACPASPNSPENIVSMAPSAFLRVW
jgi:hypothetical protein